MKKISIIILMSGLLAAGCSMQDIQAVNEDMPQQDALVVENPIHFVANADTDEQGDTKTVLDGTSVKWNGDETVTVFGTDGGGVTLTGTYKVTGAGVSASLVYAGTGKEFGEDDSPSYAVYPSGTLNADGKTISFTLPAEQTYTANSFADGANIAVGKVRKGTIDAYDIDFKNVCSYLNLKLSVGSGQAATVGKIVLKSKDQVKISGVCTVDASAEAPTAVCVGDTVITLNCGQEGVTITSKATSFYFVVPAATFGFDAEVYSTTGRLITTLSSSSAKTFKRKTAKNIAVPAFSWLPEAYTEVKWLESTGTQYISCGFWGDAVWTITASATAVVDSSQCVISSTVEGDRGTWYGEAIKTGCWGVGGDAGQYSTFASTDTVTAVLAFDSLGVSGKIYKTGETPCSVSRPISTKVKYQGTWIMFGTLADDYFFPFVGKVYDANVCQKDVKNHWFIPCYRNSDKKPGMYDIPAVRFLTNGNSTGDDFNYE